MLQLLAQGWKLVMQNKRSLAFVSLYQLSWTVILFTLFERILSPLIRVMPDKTVSQTAATYFWTEAKFMAAKTNLLIPYLLIILGLLLSRMIISPFIQSGVFGTLANSKRQEEHNQFLTQMKTYWKPFTIIYWIKSIAILVPAIIVLMPLVKTLIGNYFTMPLQDLPWLAISQLLIWMIIVKSLCYSILISIVNQLNWRQTLINFSKKIIQLLAIFLIIFIFSTMIHGAFQLTSLLFASFVSTLLFFLLPIIQTFMKAWTISTHTIQLSE